MRACLLRSFDVLRNARAPAIRPNIFLTPSSILKLPDCCAPFAAPDLDMRSHGSGRIALRFSLLLSLLLAASCCELEFLSPLQFSIHAAESIELRVQVATLASPPPSGCACDTSPVCSAPGAHGRSHRSTALARGRENFYARQLFRCEVAAQRRIHTTRNCNRESI